MWGRGQNLTGFVPARNARIGVPASRAMGQHRENGPTLAPLGARGGNYFTGPDTITLPAGARTGDEILTIAGRQHLVLGRMDSIDNLPVMHHATIMHVVNQNVPMNSAYQRWKTRTMVPTTASPVVVEFAGVAVTFAENDGMTTSPMTPGTPAVTNDWAARMDLAAAAHGFTIAVRVVRFRHGATHAVYPVFDVVIEDIRSYLNEQMAVMARHIQASPNGRVANMVDQLQGKLTRNRREATLAVIQNYMFWGVAMGTTPEHLITLAPGDAPEAFANDATAGMIGEALTKSAICTTTVSRSKNRPVTPPITWALEMKPKGEVSIHNCQTVWQVRSHLVPWSRVKL